MAEQGYGEEYFLSHCGLPYHRDEPHWFRFFGEVARRIDETLSPRTVFDAGCAIGFLVEALRSRGIEAFGRDFSSYAIEQIPVGLRPFCECGSIAEPIEGSYDLVTCIEVLEHMPADEARRAVESMCRASSRILFSSSPTDFTEETHINVQPPRYWMQMFAEQGFGPRADYDGSFLCPWAILFERRSVPPEPAELDAQAHLVLARMRISDNKASAEAGMRSLLAQLQGEMNDLQNRFTALQAGNVEALKGIETHQSEVTLGLRARGQDVVQYSEHSAHIEKAEAELNALRDQLALLQASCANNRATLEEQRAKASRNQQAHERELAFSKRQLSRNETEIAELRNRISALENRRSMFRLRIGNKSRKRNALTLSAPRPEEIEVLSSGLFDAEWYQANNPDIGPYDGGLLRHYFEFGAHEGRDPNPHFSTNWYVATYPAVVESGLNPLLHYVRVGSEIGFRPSADFDPAWYRKTYPDIDGSGLDPLLHYLKYGHAESRRRHATDQSRDVADAQITVLKAPVPASELVLFVTHAPKGKIKPHVPLYLEALKQAGLSTVVIVAAAPSDKVDTTGLIEHADGLLLRENDGYDFAAWAHALRYLDLSSINLLCLANDSLIGPFSAGALRTIMDRARSSTAQLVALTDSHELKRHFQSYFLVAKNDAVRVLADFLGKVRALNDKHQVIMAYELQVLDALEAEGIVGEALFPTTDARNNTLTDWRELVEAGFPFVKAAVLQLPEAQGWQETLAAKGYDPAIAEESLAIIRSGWPVLPKPAADAAHPAIVPTPRNVAAMSDLAAVHIAELERELIRARNRPWKQVRNKFKFKLYRSMARLSSSWSAKAAAKYERRAQKRDPKRPPSLPGQADLAFVSAAVAGHTREYSGAVPHDPHKPNMLVVSHEASRSGAPILALNIAQALASRYNVTTVSLLGGELIDDFCAVSQKVFDANLLSMSASSYEALLQRICGEHRYEFAVVNSIQSHAVLPVLHELGVPSLALLHEFAAYIGKKAAFPEAMRWASETVFSTRLTLESALDYVRDFTPREHILPQGKCEVPYQKRSRESREAARRQLLDVFRPGGEEKRRVTVLGAGTVEIRKGVDLFLEVAAQVRQADGGEKVHFVWIGGGYDPEHDFGYSVFLRDQLKRAGLENHVTMLPATSEIELAYELSDVLLVSSRLDPLPNVAVDALCVGLPVICFENTTGIADILSAANLKADCVAGYLDTGDAARKILQLAASEDAYARVSSEAKRVGQATFDFEQYVREIETLGLNAKARKVNFAADVDEILSAGEFRGDFFHPPLEPMPSPTQLVHDYFARLQWVPGPRKPEPGFNPFIYATSRDSGYDHTREAYADFLRKGRPAGPWLTPVLEGGLDATKGLPATALRSALHIHAYFTGQLQEIIERLEVNDARPDLFVSTGSRSSADEIERILARYSGRVAALEEVPNAGRDIGPLLTQFGPRLIATYDMVGHVHIKKSQHVTDLDMVRVWSEFLFENVLGGPVGGRMLDLILNKAESDERIGVIYPDDPHVIGWTRNMAIAERLAARMGHPSLARSINFPVGTMFWMRTAALKPFVDLGFDWPDYPNEPIPEDGTLLHALERLFGVVPPLEGWRTVVTNIRGVSR
ncbi:rhamnan synthesis F family protein [Ancylobacter moscoviensis]